MSSIVADDVTTIFKKAKDSLLSSLKDKKHRAEIEDVEKIDDVWKYTKELQHSQSEERALRGMKKIDPFLKRLEEYATVIEIFVQVKPEILALIWGPIKLLLRISSNHTQSFDAVLEVMNKFGLTLPSFEKFIPIFESNDSLKYLLGLFFQDIMEFYLVSLKLFTAKGWKSLFQALWPASLEKIRVISQNIEKHSLLLVDEITLSDVLEAHKARVAALERYAETYEFQKRQDFHLLESSICPQYYDEKLDQILRDRCQGTGTWLLRDEQFLNWYEGKNESSRVLWLQGIPGAGKTFLCRTVVDKTKALGHSLFAFPSYKHLESSLKILHSLIFQLASRDPDLKAVLCSSVFTAAQDQTRDLKGNSSFALKTFITMLEYAGSTYITVDGLDEIEESVQVDILGKLGTVCEKCPSVRLFVSSRKEDKIERALKAIATVLRIDERNTECIRTYADHQIQSWLHDSGFDDEAQSEIRQLLTPLTEKAKGMFLYARIVLKSVQELQDIDSIREQLTVLPENLDDAYERIVQRILASSKPRLKFSKRLLSWVACSPIPVTRREMEQALIVQPDKKTIPRVLGPLNTLQLCGPLVEIKNEVLEFVHFTVKEYLLRRRNQKADKNETFLSEADALLDLSITCLAYLCSDALETELPENGICQNLLSGRYRLLDFATSQWAECVRLYARACSKELPDELVALLDDLRVRRSNADYDKTTESRLSSWGWSKFKEKPEACEIVSRSLDFRRRLQGSYNWRLDEDNGWLSLDPTTMSSVVQRVYHFLWKSSCSEPCSRSSCRCATISNHYGPRPYKCPFVTCRACWETSIPLGNHLLLHERPFKCEVPTCTYSTIGFSSSERLKDHLNKHPRKPEEHGIVENVEKLPKEELYDYLIDLVKKDQVDEMRCLLPRIQSGAFDMVQIAGLVATNGGSREMARLFVVDYKVGREWRHMDDIALKTAQSNNSTMFAVLCEEWGTIDLGLAAVKINFQDILDVWLNHLISRGEWSLSATLGFLPASPSPVIEPQLANFWVEQHALGNFTDRHATEGLKNVAQRSCSLVLAEALVKCGADINYNRQEKSKLTPLQWAARKTTFEAAQLVQFLLLAGADPDVQVEIVNGSRKGTIIAASMEDGARGISKHLGMDWSELVQKAANERENQARI